MEKQFYPLSASQQIVKLQTTLNLFKRVGNIMFVLTFDEPYDRDVMRKAFGLLFERIDSLRTRFVKKDGKTVQYFAESGSAGEIPEITLSSYKKQTAFEHRYRRGMLKPSKGETLKAVFAKGPDGKDLIYVKVSHFAADTAAIGVIVSDLLGVYDALKKGTELPEAPAAFEPVLKKDVAFLENEDLLKKDQEFFEDYYRNRHPEHAVYCGLHGGNCELWQKQKRKGRYSVPYLFVRCDTEGSRYVIPKAIVKQAVDWCGKEQVTIANFFYYAYAVACSLRNDREKYQQNLILLNSRSTVAEKKCAGTKVQSVGMYTTVDYEKSWNENIKALVAEQSELYRHTRMSYVDVQGLQHKVWGHSPLTQLDNFCYSFIPFKTPAGVSMQVCSNGKGTLCAYVALMFNPDTFELQAVYDVQPIMTSPVELTEFQNVLIRTIEAVLESPEKKLGEIL